MLIFCNKIPVKNNMSSRDYLRNKMEAMPKKMDDGIFRKCKLENFATSGYFGYDGSTLSKYNPSSCKTLFNVSCPSSRGDMGAPSLFVDNTIRLNSGVSSLLNPCCDPNIAVLTKAYNSKKDPAKTFFSFYKPFTRTVNKPWVGPQGYQVQPFNVGNKKVGGYVPIRSLMNNVMPKHGNPLVGLRYNYQGRLPLYGNYVALKIDRPTLFNIKG
jgi:hypothetical protein